MLQSFRTLMIMCSINLTVLKRKTKPFLPVLGPDFVSASKFSSLQRQGDLLIIGAVTVERRSIRTGGILFGTPLFLVPPLPLRLGAPLAGTRREIRLPLRLPRSSLRNAASASGRDATAVLGLFQIKTRRPVKAGVFRADSRIVR